MAASVENESEILLGNKQLLAVFAVVAFLLAIAFTGGYMLGKSSTEKKAVAGDTQPSGESGTALVPRIVSPEDSSPKSDVPAAKVDVPPPAPVEDLKPVVRVAPAVPLIKHPVENEPLLGRRNSEGTPKPGQTFVQVAALTHTEAAAMADVLRKQQFAARVAPKPGSITVFRVLVGPARDAGEITATRDALRKIGFREVIIQRY